jgi:amidase
MTLDRSPGLAESARALAAGEVTAQALVEQALARIEASQGSLNAFRIVRTRAALAEAEAADAELAAGIRKPLLGVPVAVKDDMDVAGEPTAFGCRGEFPAVARDGEAVRRLRAAGAVIVGKTNTCEFGQWPFTEGPAFGETRNPWSPEHTPGGSSGGSAAAVAAGLVPAALGSDGAGWHQAAARPCLDLAARRVLPGHHGQRHARPYGRRRRPAVGRGEREPRPGPAPAARRQRLRGRRP